MSLLDIFLDENRNIEFSDTKKNFVKFKNLKQDNRGIGENEGILNSAHSYLYI